MPNAMCVLVWLLMKLTSAKLVSDASPNEAPVSVTEVISAMTFALDLTEGARPGHALRTCLMGMRLAEALGVPDDMRANLYYALQLKDIGCSNNAARMTCIVGGDDRVIKAIAKLSDWTRPHRPEIRTIKLLWANILPQSSWWRRALRLLRIGLTQHHNNRVMIDLRCERGAEIIRSLELGHATAEAVLHLDEHWNGKGFPDNLRGEEIPLMSRICSVAQNLDVFAEDSEEAAISILRQRSGRWFDPDIVWMAELLHKNGTLWVDARHSDNAERTRAAVMAMTPHTTRRTGPQWIDKVCEAFGSVVDAKSPFTYRHSLRVSEMATSIAEELDLQPQRVDLVRRAALLHDLGKLSVPNTILDKETDLSKDDWSVVKRHPEYTRDILDRVNMFRDVAVVAGEHHERLDGTGYPQQLVACDISLESRVLVMADCYTALAEERPYRKAMTPLEAVATLRASVPEKLDAHCFDALRRVIERRESIASWVRINAHHASAELN